MMPRHIVTTTWATCLAIAFVIVKVLRIGPVILVVNDDMGWGVHTGDFLAMIPLAVALAVTIICAK